MFCKKCGQQIADDSQFCPKCGTNQHAVNQVQNRQQINQPTYQDSGYNNQKSTISEEDSIFSIKGLFVPKGRRNTANFAKLAVPLVSLVFGAFYFAADFSFKAQYSRSGLLIGLSDLFFVLWLIFMYINAVNISKRMMDCNNNKFISFGLTAALYLINQAFLDAFLQYGRSGVEIRRSIAPLLLAIWVVYVISNVILMFCKGTPGNNNYGPEPK